MVSAAGNLSSARIWHACEGDQQIERVESLSGRPRATFRRNDQVVTFFPESRVAVVETRESLGLFPGLLQSNNSSISDTYKFRRLGMERIAGYESDVVVLQPHDNMRFGYRVWTERRTGLVMQLQTLDMDGRVLEQAAFSELQLESPVSLAKLHQMMGNTGGYRVERPDLQKVTVESAGWAFSKIAAGFKSMGCFKRAQSTQANASNKADTPLQCVFSDGLATVSLFVEPWDIHRHGREGYTDLGGATRTLTRRMDSAWVTVVGEVPISTLMSFALGLERKK